MLFCIDYKLGNKTPLQKFLDIYQTARQLNSPTFSKVFFLSSLFPSFFFPTSLPPFLPSQTVPEFCDISSNEG